MRQATSNSCCGDLGTRVRALEHQRCCLNESHYPAGLQIPPPASEFASLCVALDGGYRERQGRTWLQCEPASVIFHPAGHEHANVISDTGSRCLNVLIDDSLLDVLPRAASDRLRGDTALRAVPRQQAFELRVALRRADAEAEFEIEELLLLLLADLARLPALSVARTPPPWLVGVRERVHDDFARGFDLEDLARSVGIHRVHLARAWRAHFGCTLGQFIRQRRVEFACRALTSTVTGLSEIALAAGFVDQSHFTHTFRNLVGLTPGAFRARFTS